MDIEKGAAEIVDAAVKVHTALGPGLLEGAYEACLIHELRKRGLRCERQVLVPIEYDGEQVEAGLRLDVVVEGIIILELKAVDQVLPEHKAQLLTYLKLTRRQVGFLINFNVMHLCDGLQRVVHKCETSPLRAKAK